jgi:glycosyltransferase involved in cell wall biosynthesis
MLSRLSRMKGVEDFLDAAATVAARVENAHFLVIGDNINPDGSAYRRELEARAARLGLASRVVFTGFRLDVPRLLSARRGLGAALPERGSLQHDPRVDGRGCAGRRDAGRRAAPRRSSTASMACSFHPEIRPR